MYIYLDMVAEFSCAMCGKCCRNDWLVTLDEESYKRNEEYFAAQGKSAEFGQAFVPLTGINSLGEYAYITKAPNGGCYFLATENYCRLHRAAGHEHLDNVCQTFPRYPMSTARGLELTLTLNCPAVFEKINRVAPLQVIRASQAPCVVNPDSSAVHVFPSQQSKTNPLHYYFELEQHFIDIMQWRSLGMEQRLQFLGRTIIEINKIPQGEGVGQFLNQIINRNYTELDASGSQVNETNIVTPEILLEHFFVNIIFQKDFYTYGLLKGMELLDSFWQRVIQTDESGKNSLDDREKMKNIIMDMAFQHNHHRRS